MRVVVIDDEILALKHLSKLLEAMNGIQVIGQYDHPYLALEAIKNEQPNVVFLDIDMPLMSGIELAEKIEEVCSGCTIVFVTGYDQYAVKAFELNAIDYIMKPVHKKRLELTVKRLKEKGIGLKSPAQYSGVVCCFQTLQFKRSFDDVNAIDVNWRTSKAKELFLYLLHHRSRPVRKDTLLDLFWSDFEASRGYAQLYAAIYQIRKTLKMAKINISIMNYDNNYVLELNDVKLDIDEWETGLTKMSYEDSDHSYYQRILSMYQGDYLVEEGYLWAENERERLRVLWNHSVKKVTDFLIFKEEYTGAILLYKRAQTLHPFIEDHYFRLMKLYDLIGDRSAVEQQYDSLKAMLKQEYDSVMNDSVQDWYERWRIPK